MSTQPKPLTSAEMGLMKGFPPAPDKTVTHANQLNAPYNRWSFQNELALNPVVDVWRGCGPASVFEYEPFDMQQVKYYNRAGAEFSFEDMVEMSHTDGIIALRQGKIIYERYLNGMQLHTLHCWASCSKSMTGTLAALLAHEAGIDLEADVCSYLPELEASGFAGATVRQLMDMTTALRFQEDSPDPVNENIAYGLAMGWIEKPFGYTGPANVYDFLPTIRKDGEHGARFTYLTPNTDVLAWLMKRKLGKSLAEIMREKIWSRLSAERDAYWIVGPGAVETAGSGLITTLPDMARFGQMLLQKGQFNSQQVLPPGVVAEIEAGASRAAFARGPTAGPTNQGWSYHAQWWITHNEHGAYLGLGYGGQMLYIDPTAQLVIAKFSSYPTPTPAGNEFYAAMAAFPALANALVK